MGDGMEEIKVVAPGPGRCPYCATIHKKGEPHDRDSLYYQNRFFRDNGRFPTWEDAMRHCDDATKEAWTKKLKRRGIDMETERRAQSAERR